MILSAVISDIEKKGFEISRCTVESETDCTISFRKVAKTSAAAIVATEIKAVSRQTVKEADLFSKVRDWCEMEEADKYITAGDQILIPSLYIPGTTCEDEDFDEINLKDVIITAVHTEPHRVVFNFDDIVFRHDIDKNCSGKAFEETPLGIYLVKHFSEALEKHTGKVKVSLLTKENVFDENSRDFMPYFKPIKNRIKVLADENDTWHWWLKTPYASNSASFCLVASYGSSGGNIASLSDGGVAPAFEITAESE